MLQENVSVPEKPTQAFQIWTDDGEEVNREEIVRVLVRAAEDDSFIARLTYQGDQALQSYDLTWREKAALLSGDIRWIERHLGKLNTRLRTWLDCRLQQEIW
jgi:hypothetical protein